ncbi:MAG: IPT/TIG domain-containing protein, partial [Actinomycetota bacterium]
SIGDAEVAMLALVDSATKAKLPDVAAFAQQQYDLMASGHITSVTDTAGTAVPITLSTDSAIAATVSASTVTWQSSGAGTLSWDSTYSPPDCGTVHFSGTVSQTVSPATPVPAVSSLSPREGSTDGGTAVSIRGTGFGGATAVIFGSTRARFTVNSDSLITVLAPSSLTRAGLAVPRVVDVVVQTPAGSSAATLVDRFSYVAPPEPAPAPVVTSISVSSGSTGGGDHVVILGAHFTGATSVAFGDATAASFSVSGDGYITAVSPAHSSAAETISVTTPTGTGSGPAFSFLSPTRPVPTDLRFSPAGGSQLGGQLVTVSGQNLVDVVLVTVGGTAVPFTNPPVVAGHKVPSLTFVTPAVAHAGTVPVVITTVVGSGSRPFQFQSSPAPSGITVAPAHASQLGGATVTVSGKNIQNASRITIGGLIVPFQVAVPAKASATSGSGDVKYSLVLPARAKAGAEKVVVTTIVGSGSGSFTFDAAKGPTGLKLRTFHGSQLGGELVSLTGQNISNPTSVTIGGVEVAFAVQGSTATSPASPSSAQISFITPPSVRAGSVRVVVNTIIGSGSTTFSYDRAASPASLRLTPAKASQLGGDTVRLEGENIGNVLGVTVGGVSVPFGFASLSAAVTKGGTTGISFVVPGSTTPGPVPVQVRTIVGSGKTTFTYTPAAAPSALHLSSREGSQVGGQVLTVSGLNLKHVSRVTIGGLPVAFTEIPPSSNKASAGPTIRFTTPGSTSAGPAPVTVTTIVGTASVGYSYASAPAPSALKLSPASGTQLGGEVVKLSGQDIDLVRQVTVGGVPAEFLWAAARSGQPGSGILSVTIPASAVSGRVPIVVTTITGSGTVTFTYTEVGAS